MNNVEEHALRMQNDVKCNYGQYVFNLSALQQIPVCKACSNDVHPQYVLSANAQWVFNHAASVSCQHDCVQSMHMPVQSVFNLCSIHVQLVFNFVEHLDNIDVGLNVS